MKKIFLIFFIFYLYHPLAKSQNFSFCKETDVVRDNCHGNVEYEKDGHTITYVGNFKDNKPHGKGIHTYYLPGNNYPYKVVTYEGTTYFGKFNGKFKVTYQDKSYDISYYKLNNLHGKSFAYDKAGKVLFESTFENDKKVKLILFYDPPLLDNTVKIEINYDREENETTKYIYYKDGSKNLARDAEKERAMARASENDRKMIERAQRVNNVNKKNNEESSSPKDFLKKILGK